jgi:hypothetical protein
MQHYTYDTFAGRKAKEYCKIEGKLHPNEKKIILLQIMEEACKYQEALEFIYEMRQESSSEISILHQATMNYVEGVCLRKTNQTKEAVKKLQVRVAKKKKKIFLLKY